MKTSRTQSNQWSVGMGLRRSTIYDSSRWMLWINYGFNSWSLSWKLNPPAPRTSGATCEGQQQ